MSRRSALTKPDGRRRRAQRAATGAVLSGRSTLNATPLAGRRGCPRRAAVLVWIGCAGSETRPTTRVNKKEFVGRVSDAANPRIPFPQQHGSSNSRPVESSSRHERRQPSLGTETARFSRDSKEFNANLLFQCFADLHIGGWCE
jgi:hypothetical protein